jgi:hypothetical protein
MTRQALLPVKQNAASLAHVDDMRLGSGKFLGGGNADCPKRRL